MACTYLLFTSCIVFFRAATFEDAAWIYGHLFTGWGAIFTDFEAFREVLVTIGFDLKMTLTLLVGLAFTEGLEAFDVPMHEFIRRYPLVLRWLLYYALAAMILFCGAFGKSAFIYQNF